jgi:maltooligosyltrehalose trehalohydrolase
MGDGRLLSLLANLSARAIGFGQVPSDGTIIWGGNLSDTLSPWAVHWHIGDT